MRTEDMYFKAQKRNEVQEAARMLRRKFLRYQQAEIVYSLSHKKLMELANEAGAIYRKDGIVLINRDIFDDYLERFHEVTLNKAIRRIIRECNDAQLNKGLKNPVLLPSFSCHSLRHTFTTRLVEAGVNMKVVQDVLGHADFSTTMDIYTDVTKELKQREFDNLEGKLKAQRKPKKEEDE